MGLVLTYNERGVGIRKTVEIRFAWERDERADEEEEFVAWADMILVKLCDPFPQFEVRHRLPARDDEASIRFATFAEKSEHKWIRPVAMHFLREATERGVEVDRGWADAESIGWERVSKLPSRSTSAAGAYRTLVDIALARRPAPTLIANALSWWSSSPDAPLSSVAQDVVVTSTWVFVKRWHGRCERVPLATLRAKFDEEDGASRYVFGRDATLSLPKLPDCEVMELLDARLAKLRASRG